MNKGLDLSGLTPSPIAFHVPTLGDVVVQARTTDLLLWVARGMDACRWQDGAAMLRDLLTEQARTSGGEATDPARVAALTSDALEAGAAAFLTAVDSLFGEASSDKPQVEGELASERMKRGLVARVESAAAPVRRMAAEIERPLRQIRRIGAVEQYMEQQQRRLQEMIRPVNALTSAYGSAALRHIEMFDAAEQLRRATRWTSYVDDMFPAVSAVSRMHENLRRLTEQHSLDRVYPQLAALSALPQTTVFENRFFEDALGLSRLLQRQFDFRTPALALASLGALHVAEPLSEALNRAGFQATVVAAFDGLAAQGAASDVLGRYNLEIDPEAPVFAAVMDGVTALDAEDMQERTERLEIAVARLTELIAELHRREGRPVILTGVYNGVMLVLAAAAVLISYAAWQGDVVERKEPGVAAIVAKIDALKAAQPDPAAQRDLRYVHDRAWLRSAPHAEAMALRAVFPDQPLRVLEGEGAWAKVEVYDYASDRPMVGWISRRRLRVSPLR